MVNNAFLFFLFSLRKEGETEPGGDKLLMVVTKPFPCLVGCKSESERYLETPERGKGEGSKQEGHTRIKV